MADYSINPQFANLSGLQPLPALDLTRGGSLQFQALQPIQVVSSQPELVAQGIAGAVQGVAQGALSGITAKWQKEEDLAKEQRKYEHELELASAKKKSEDLDFAQKELLKFDIAHSGDADYQERRKQVEEALYGRVRDVTPQKEPSESVKKAQEESEKEHKTSEDPKYKEALREAQDGDLKKEIQKIDAQTPLPEMEGVGEKTKPPVSPALTGVTPPVVETKPSAPAPALAEVKPPVDGTKLSSPPKIDTVPLPEPEISGERFASRDAALAAKRQSETNPHWDVKVVGPDSKGYFHLETESKFKDVTDVQRQERDDWYKQQDLELKKQKAQQDAQKSAQEMQIRQQKVKDEDKIWAVQVEDAAKSLKAINDVISIIKNNPRAVGKASATVAAFPFIDTDASRIRNKLNTIQGDTAIRALTAMRLAAPTGAAVGNVSDKDMELFKASEGALDPDTQTDKDILPVLRDIYRKRLETYNESVGIIKNKNPEYTPPEIKYTPEDKKTSKKQQDIQSEERVRVKAPYQKNGQDVFGTIPKSEVDKKLSEGFTLAPLTQ